MFGPPVPEAKFSRPACAGDMDQSKRSVGPGLSQRTVRRGLLLRTERLALHPRGQCRPPARPQLEPSPVLPPAYAWGLAKGPAVRVLSLLEAQEERPPGRRLRAAFDPVADKPLQRELLQLARFRRADQLDQRGPGLIGCQLSRCGSRYGAECNRRAAAESQGENGKRGPSHRCP